MFGIGEKFTIEYIEYTLTSQILLTVRYSRISRGDVVSQYYSGLTEES
jgi:hypothetical protein